MNNPEIPALCLGRRLALALLAVVSAAQGQTLLNVDFGVGVASPKMGPAATGLGTNDFWNLYRHYEPKFLPGMALVSNGKLEKLKLADGTESAVSLAITNAPGVWGNASGDPMYDSYIFSQNGSNITATLTGLVPGRYHFFLYGHADADVSGEQNSSCTLRAGTNTFGPLAQTGGSGWKAGNPWQERSQFVVFRDVPVDASPVVIEAAPGPNGIAVLNGLQILSRGTGPPRLLASAPHAGPPASTNLLFHEIRYEGKVSDSEARFAVWFQVESLTTNELSTALFEGDMALVLPELPPGLRIVSHGRQTRLFCSRPGTHAVKLDLIAKLVRAEPWNQISFTGPPAAIASVAAAATSPGVELQLLSGTPITQGRAGVSSAPTPDPSAGTVKGLLGADRTVALRWQSKSAEISRKSLVTVDTAATAQLTPTVIKFNTALHYEILQAPVSRLVLELPASHALTRIQGEQIRDWRVGKEGGRQLLTLEFIKPQEKSCALTLFSEQSLGSSAVTATLLVPEPLEVQRESGSLALTADDTLVEIESLTGLRQVNAPAGAMAAYRFNGRPVALIAKLKPIEPVLKMADRITARLEETRLLVTHAISLSVERAGIYALDLTPQSGFVVTEVRGEGIDDWKMAEGKLRISFAARVLGARKFQVQLEQANKQFPERIALGPLAVAGVTNVVTQLGAASSPGIRLKTADVSNLREMPINSLPDRTDELLAFAGDQADWNLILASEKLTPRVVAEVFNLVTIGDGVVGGSATLRFGIINQGVQEFRVAVPAHWKNLEFTGANIRHKEQQTNVWTIALQDKAWGGYTLVITYDYQFDPKGATLDLAGAHALNIERETGSLGLMTAASLKLTPALPVDPLHRVDEAELSESDRALCTRALLLAYKYSGGSYRHSVQVTRFDEVPVLDAVADRTELTTVLTEEGQLLTQASFMVKNNEKQFQRFKLPASSEFWSSYVNGQPAKPERDGDWYLVPLPRDANRDQAFAVDMVYAQKINLKTSLFPRHVELMAPLTDIPNTYAEWQLFAPPSQRLSKFGGNMTVAAGTTYNFHDAWQQFLGFYGDFIDRNFGSLVLGFLAALVVVLIGVAFRRGAKGVLSVIVVFAIFAILAAMMLPALSRAKFKSQRISAMSNLKQIGLAARIWSADNQNQMPPNFESMKNELGSDKVTLDPNTGQRFVYVGTGKSDAYPEAILAYTPSDLNGRAVLFADGSVQILNQEKFDQAMQRDAALPRAVVSANAPAASAAPAVPPTLAPAVAGIVAANQSAARPPSAPPAIDPTTGLPMVTTNGIAAVEPTTGLPINPPGLRRSGFGGGVGGGTGGGGGGVAAALQEAKPTAAGVRPIRIEIPRAGQAFNFTKVLNAGREPLTLTVSMVRVRVYRTLQMVLQVCAFILGLILLWAFSLSTRPRSFWMSVAAALVLWSVISLLTMWRLLHVGLIVAAPLLLFGLITWVGWQIWLRRKAVAESASPPPPPLGPAAGGAAPAGAVTLFLLATVSSWPFSSSADLATPAPADAISILSADYSGTVGDKAAHFDAVLRLATFATNQTVPLFGDDVAVEAFTSEGGARLVREAPGIAVLLPAATNVTLRLKLVARLGGDISRRQLAFSIPPALASQVALAIDEPDAEVEFPTAVAFQRASSAQQTRIQAVLGPADRLELNWTPRVKRAAEIAATVFVQNTALVTLGGGVVNARATLDYQISQGELRQLRVQIPAGHRVLRVEGESLRLWELKDDTLLVELLKGVSPSYRLTIETERLLDKIPATVRVELPHALEVKRETGLVALRGGEELSFSVEEARDLQRVDVEEFNRASLASGAAVPTASATGVAPAGPASAFRFLKPDFALTVHAEPIQPQLEAVVRNQVRIGADALRLTAQVDYTIKRAGIFALRLSLPAGYRLESLTGASVAQWLESSDGDARLLEVKLKERTLGACSLQAALKQDYKETPRTIPIAGVHPLGTEKLNGVITVTTELGIAARTESLDGLTEIPYASAGAPAAADAGSGSAQTSTLAYKFAAPTPNAAPSWRLTVATESVEPWTRAEIVNTVALTETLLTGRALVKYEIANAPVKEFRLRVPLAFQNVDITGAQIRRRDQTNGEWRVELQSKVRGDYILVVSWELPRNASTNLLQLTGVQALGVERESGFLSVVTRPPLQVSEKSATELLSKIDVRELPEWAGRADGATVLAYRYLRPGYSLAVEAKRFEEAEVLQALIESIKLTTVVADDGQLMTEAAISIRNQGRQHLEIELPTGATVWSAFVGGEPVRPSKREGKLLLALNRDIAADAAVAVELTFIGAEPFPKYHGSLSLISPRFDVPLKNARWDLYLPPDYDYSRFEGSMSRVSDLAAPMVQVYSLSEYNEQQHAQEEEKSFASRYGLKAARENLSTGNLRDAVNNLRRAKANSQQAAPARETEQDVKQVEQELRKAQGGNLLNAQNAYYWSNNGQLSDQQQLVPFQAQAQGLNPPASVPAAQAAPAVTVIVNNDAEVAALQWDKLEKAQQVTAAKVTPLRVNLPTRGVHYAFAQVLQTEVRKPMTVRLLAENTKVPSWTSRLLVGLLGFCGLWLLTALVNHQRRAMKAARG
jgi:type II secretory pathway pseudopilin PulG